MHNCRMVHDKPSAGSAREAADSKKHLGRNLGERSAVTGLTDPQAGLRLPEEDAQPRRLGVGVDGYVCVDGSEMSAKVSCLRSSEFEVSAVSNAQPQPLRRMAQTATTCCNPCGSTTTTQVLRSRARLALMTPAAWLTMDHICA